MHDLTLKVATGQARSVYDVIVESGSVTAAEIGKKLDVLPNTIYRAAEHLIKLGVIQKTSDYPVRFVVFNNKNAVDWYASAARKSFTDSFLIVSNLAHPSSDSPAISFIKNRPLLLKQTNRDTSTAKKEINFIVSGLLVPDETVLAYRKATMKGVRIRALVQRKKETSSEKLEKWHNLGIEVKQTANLGVRMFTFDAQVVYFTSYSIKNKDEAFGIRFNYAPLAALMSDFFEEQWLNATEIIA